MPSNLKYILSFSDTKLNFLQAVCSEVIIPINDGRLKLTLNENRSSLIKSLLKTYRGKTIETLTIKLIEHNEVKNTHTYTNVELVPVSIKIDDNVNYIVEVVAESHVSTNEW
jgi:hypothetical protein